MLSDHWPLFDLRVRTPRVELRYPTDDDLALLADLTLEPVHDESFMPFSIPWTRTPSPQRERKALQFWWQSRAELTPERWRMNLLVSVDGEVVGVQDVMAVNFPIARSATTGSWLVQRRQGDGIGTAMRAAVLHLLFAGLGASEAHTEAFEDNAPSLGVTRSIGYRPNGSRIDVREGRAVRHEQFVLTRRDWEQRRRDDIVIENLDPCLPVLGLASFHEAS
jgi:RimJ/RimL family protein N-acetyltransferase